jgi:hypothetical protein
MSNYKGYYLKSLGLHESNLSDEEDEKKEKAQPFNPEELEQGQEAEDGAEDPALADKIAKDNLSDDPEYYSRLKKAGLEDHPEIPSHPKMRQLVPQLSPTAKAPQVLAVGILGTKNGVLPAGGIVGDPEKARLGGLELVKNLKPNSQGAIADTPVSADMAAKGGHFTPNNSEITGDQSPITNVKGSNAIHPMQVQQLGNPPFNDDGTTHDGKTSPPSAVAGVEGGSAPTPEDKPSDAQLRADIGIEDEEGFGEQCGPWGIPVGGEEKQPEEPEELEIDIKEVSAVEDPSNDFMTQRAATMQKRDRDDRRRRDYDFGKFGRNRWGGKSDQELKRTSKDLFRDIKSGKYEQVFTPEQKESLRYFILKGWMPLELERAHPDDPGNQNDDKVRIRVFKFDVAGDVKDVHDIETDGRVDGQPPEEIIGRGLLTMFKERMQKLANINKPACSTCGSGNPDTNLKECPSCGRHLKDESGMISELSALVQKMKASGKSSPLLEKAAAYLSKHKK